MNYPKAIGPYSAYRVVGDLVFCSGQVPIDPSSNELVSGIEAQTNQSLKNIGAILNELGLSYENVIKATIFLSDMKDFAIVNDIYAKFFKEPYPARSAVAVKDLPKGARIEIEVIAHKSV